MPGHSLAAIGAEGVEAKVVYKGSELISWTISWRRAQRYGYSGAKNIRNSTKKPLYPNYQRGTERSHVHDVQVAKKAPNYDQHSSLTHNK